jgi:prohibitin 2
VNVQQDTREITAECFSSDLQQINIQVKILYRIPEASAVSVLRDYAGNPFDKLILPRVQEATKEVTALKTAADIVKTREQIKVAALHGSRQKIGTLLVVEDLVIEDIALSRELEQAIEAKMVQQQEAEKAVFRMQQARTDAETQIIKAKADAEAIRIQGEALEKAPRLVDLKMVEKWNGVAPQVVGAGSNILLPLDKTPAR